MPHVKHRDRCVIEIFPFAPSWLLLYSHVSDDTTATEKFDNLFKFTQLQVVEFGFLDLWTPFPLLH